MLTNKEIVEQIQNDESYYQALQTIMKGHPRKNELIGDLYHEMLLIILNYCNDKLNKLVDKGHLKFYWVRIGLNQWQSSSSPFYYKYVKDSRELEYDMDLSHLQTNEEFEIEKGEPYHKLVRKVTEQSLAELDAELERGWYLVKLFREYVKLGSYRAVSEVTRIPEPSIGSDIRLVKGVIKKNINKELERKGR